MPKLGKMLLVLIEKSVMFSKKPQIVLTSYNTYISHVPVGCKVNNARRNIRLINKLAYENQCRRKIVCCG